MKWRESTSAGEEPSSLFGGQPLDLWCKLQQAHTGSCLWPLNLNLMGHSAPSPSTDCKPFIAGRGSLVTNTPSGPSNRNLGFQFPPVCGRGKQRSYLDRPHTRLLCWWEELFSRLLRLAWPLLVLSPFTWGIQGPTSLKLYSVSFQLRGENSVKS